MKTRTFIIGEKIGVVDYWSPGIGLGEQAYAIYGKIIQINQEKQTVMIVLYGSTYIQYSINDYGILFFDTLDEAQEAASKLPKPKSTIYQKIGAKVYKRYVYGISGEYNDGIFDLVVRFNRIDGISIKEIGKTLFLSESDVLKRKK